MFVSSYKNRHFMAHNIIHRRVCIILVICLILSSTVSASALPFLADIVASVEAGRTVAELFDMVLEDVYGPNTQLSLSDTMLVTINWTLHYLFDNTYGYDIVNPYSGNADTYHRTNATFGQLLADINNSLATTGIRFYRPMINELENIDDYTLDIANSVDSIDVNLENYLTYYDGTNTYDITHFNRNTAINTYNIAEYVSKFETIDWVDTTCQMIGVFDGPTSSANEITTYNSSLSYTDYYFRFNAMPNTENNLFRVKLPVYTNSIRWRNDIVDQLEILYGTNDMLPLSLTYDISNSGLWLDIYFSAMPTSTNSYFQIHLKTGHNCNIRNVKPYIQMLPYDSLDSLLTQYKGYLSNIHNDLQNLEIDLSNADITVDSNFDDSDILEEINNMSLVDNEVKLTPVIDTNLPSNGTNIVNRIRTFFATGVTVSEFFNQVDNAESGWFTQQNSDVINTLSGGYVNLYE